MTSLQKNIASPLHYNIILLGITGHGKSASGNTLLRKNVFISKESLKAVTQEVQMENGTFDGLTLNVYDTPGLFNSETSNENTIKHYQSLFQLDETAHTVILLVIKAERIASEEQQALHLVVELIPECFVQNTWILFTKGDKLKRENLPIEKVIEEAEEVKEVLKIFQNRYQIFDNTSQSPNQVRKLINKIRGAPKIIFPEMGFPQITSPDPVKDSLSRRIMLVGKTGVGKSATGITILRLKSKLGSTSECELHETEVSGRKISIIDTPGLFDSRMCPEKLEMEISRSIYLSSPGPHVFLYVQPVNIGFAEEEEKVFQKLEMIFGREIKKYTIFLFTYADVLEGKTVDMLIQENKSLSKLIHECGGGYHVFNNKEMRNRNQVSELLKKIDRMVEENGGNCYSNQMYEEAVGFRQEEEEERRRMEQDTEKLRRQENLESCWREEINRLRAVEEADLRWREQTDRLRREEEEERRCMEKTERLRRQEEGKRRRKEETEKLGKEETWSREKTWRRRREEERERWWREETERLRVEEERKRRWREEIERLMRDEKERMGREETKRHSRLVERRWREKTERLGRQGHLRQVERRSREINRFRGENNGGFEGFYRRYNKVFYFMSGVASGRGSVTGCVIGAIVGVAAVGLTAAGVGCVSVSLEAESTFIINLLSMVLKVRI